MSRLYANPDARIINNARIAGRSVPVGDAIVEPAPPYYDDFYMQLYAQGYAGGEVPAYVTTPSKTAALADTEPAWMYAPQNVGDPVFNLGSAGVEVGSYAAGAEIGGSAPYDRLATVVLNGTTQYVDTGWRTVLNTFNNPYAAVGGTGWTDSGTTGNAIYVPEMPTPLTLPNGERIMTGILVEGSGGSDGAAYSTVPVVAGTTYTLSFYGFRTDTSTRGFRCLVWDGDALTLMQTNALTTPVGEWVRHSFSWTPTITGTTKIRIDTAGGAGTGRMYVTGFMNSPGALKDYAPTPGQVASGAAVYQGTAHASQSDTGPFARGSKRTFIWVQNRTNTTTFDTVFGGGDATNAVIFRAQEGSEAARFYSDTALASKEWASGMPAGVSWMTLTYDDSTKAVRLYRQGAPVAASATMTGNFPAPVGSSMLLGNGYGSGGPPWAGRLGAFAVIPRALTEAEVLAVYNGTGS